MENIKLHHFLKLNRKLTRKQWRGIRELLYCLINVDGPETSNGAVIRIRRENGRGWVMETFFNQFEGDFMQRNVSKRNQMMMKDMRCEEWYENAFWRRFGQSLRKKGKEKSSRRMFSKLILKIRQNFIKNVHCWLVECWSSLKTFWDINYNKIWGGRRLKY